MKMKVLSLPLLALLVLALGTACAPTVVSEAPAAAENSPNAGSTGEETAAEDTTEVSAPGTFTIVAAESEARFYLGEVLNGSPFTVIGKTNGVEGTLVPDFATPANTAVGAIRVDLSGLQTDSGFRNRAIHDAILQTGRPEYQYAEFAPTSLSGLPEMVTIGEPFSFQISGDLTIHDVTKPVTFEAEVTPVSETRLEGLASTTITYADFGVTIPRIPPQVASVEPDAILELAFVAIP
ncbi:MAG: YceI family protein [Anaerolineae bacterium]|nr:YceI family protein [Anaerolineae bacterium]